MSNQSILDLLKQKRDEIASRKSRDSTAKLKDGDNYLRILPNITNPSADFSHAFGMHYVKTTTADGQEANTAYICTQNTFGTECPICTLVIEGRARWKNNKSKDDEISQMRSAQRYLVNGILTTTDVWDEKTKVEVVELPQTVFDEICGRMMEEISEDSGNPLDLKEGYSFLIQRTGVGRNVKYSVSVKRKTTKRELTSTYISQATDLEQYVNQQDESRLLTVTKIVSRITGIPLSATTIPSISHMKGTTPSFESLNASSLPPVEPQAPKTIVDDAVSQGKTAEYTGEQDDDIPPFDIDKENLSDSANINTQSTAKTAEQQQLDDDLAALAALDA